jgi:hypothetical protein
MLPRHFHSILRLSHKPLSRLRRALRAKHDFDLEPADFTRTSISVLTRSYDNGRDGANTHESVLTAAAVGSHGIKRLFSLALAGDGRGAEAQPLIVPGVGLPDGQTRDLVLVATMANKIFAFDANDGTPVWGSTFGTPVNGSRDIDAHLINDHWGVLSTPVVDAAAGVLYACAWISPDGSPANARHWLHAVSIADGRAVHPPLNLEGATWDPGHGLPIQKFASATRKQRASLLLVSGTVFIAFGSVRETSRDSRGWIIACDTSTWRISAAWAATAKGFGGGIWQAGSGLVADRNGFIYCMTGNGTFDAVTDWAESFLKLRYTPPAGSQPGSIAVVDWWTPWTDDGRSGLDRSGDELAIPNPTNLRVYTMDHKAGWDDMDLGSGGPVLLQELGFIAAPARMASCSLPRSMTWARPSRPISTRWPETTPSSRPRRSGSHTSRGPKSVRCRTTFRRSIGCSFSAPTISTARRSIGAVPSTDQCCSVGERTVTCARGASPRTAW